MQSEHPHIRIHFVQCKYHGDTLRMQSHGHSSLNDQARTLLAAGSQVDRSVSRLLPVPEQDGSSVTCHSAGTVEDCLSELSKASLSHLLPACFIVLALSWAKDINSGVGGDKAAPSVSGVRGKGGDLQQEWLTLCCFSAALVRDPLTGPRDPECDFTLFAVAVSGSWGVSIWLLCPTARNLLESWRLRSCSAAHAKGSARGAGKNSSNDSPIPDMSDDSEDADAATGELATALASTPCVPVWLLLQHGVLIPSIDVVPSARRSSAGSGLDIMGCGAVVGSLGGDCAASSQAASLEGEMEGV